MSKLGDMILIDIRRIKVEAVINTVGIDEPKIYELDFYNIENPAIDVNISKNYNPKTCRFEENKNTSITFSTFNMDIQEKDPNKLNVLECLWKASNNKPEGE